MAGGFHLQFPEYFECQDQITTDCFNSEDLRIETLANYIKF